MDVQSYMHGVGRAARAASRETARSETRARNEALLAMASAIERDAATLLAANAADLEQARARGLEPAMVDRLALSAKGVANMAQGLREIAQLADPIGEITDLRYRPTGIQVGRMRVPLGVIGIIYEARPNVTADAAALCLKSGNAAILRGGSEAIRCNQAIAACVHEGLRAAGLPEVAIQVIETTDRAAVGELVTMTDYVDVIVPRGGKGLIERISRDARVPVIKHLDGNCHTYVDDPCDIEQAVRVADNAKTQKYSPCNATEGLLVARGVASAFLPQIGALLAARGVEMRCCAESRAILAQVQSQVPGARIADASEQDWFEEYLAPIISVRVVAGIDEAIAHINHYGSHHTDAILTLNHVHAQRFVREVDSASVMVNASTRFADGFEYGLGAEIGISTDKFHARGPVGIEGLTSLKWVVLGDGHVRH